MAHARCRCKTDARELYSDAAGGQWAHRAAVPSAGLRHAHQRLQHQSGLQLADLDGACLHLQLCTAGTHLFPDFLLDNAVTSLRAESCLVWQGNTELLGEWHLSTTLLYALVLLLVPVTSTAKRQDCSLCQMLTMVDAIAMFQAASVGGIVLDTCKSVTLKGAATLTYQMDQYPYVQVDPATIY